MSLAGVCVDGAFVVCIRQHKRLNSKRHKYPQLEPHEADSDGPCAEGDSTAQRRRASRDMNGAKSEDAVARAVKRRDRCTASRKARHGAATSRSSPRTARQRRDHGDVRRRLGGSCLILLHAVEQAKPYKVRDDGRKAAARRDPQRRRIEPPGRRAGPGTGCRPIPAHPEDEDAQGLPARLALAAVRVDRTAPCARRCSPDAMIDGDTFARHVHRARAVWKSRAFVLNR